MVLAPDLCDLIEQYLSEFPWEITDQTFLFPGNDGHSCLGSAAQPVEPHAVHQAAEGPRWPRRCDRETADSVAGTASDRERPLRARPEGPSRSRKHSLGTVVKQ